MDAETMKLVSIVSQYGAIAIFAIYLLIQGSKDREKERKFQEKLIGAYREDTTTALAASREDMAAMRKYYDSNVVLVQTTQSLCQRYDKGFGDLLDVVRLNTAASQRLADAIERLEKKG